MSNKMMLFALPVASAALLALPAFASAEEIHFDMATSFTGSGGGGSLVAEGEPTITCENTDVPNGTISPGGTTGTMVLDFTGCHATLFGITAPCKTTGAPLSNTVASGGSFHLIQIGKTTVPGVLVTANTTELECKNVLTGKFIITHVTGNIIGTVTSPACNAESSKLVLSFSATGSTQNHLEYTGTKYDLIARTGAGGTGEPKTAGLNASVTLTANAAGTLTCT
jgi:hypothetical protein